MWCARSFFIVYKNLLAKFIQGLPYWGYEEVPPRTKNLLNYPIPTKFLFPPTKSQFNPIKKNKNIFSCSHCSCTTFVLISHSFKTQIMLILILIDVQYSQNAVFSFEKFSNGQNHSSSNSHQISPAVFTTFWHKFRETPKILGEKEQ